MGRGLQKNGMVIGGGTRGGQNTVDTRYTNATRHVAVGKGAARHANRLGRAVNRDAGVSRRSAWRQQWTSRKQLQRGVFLIPQELCWESQVLMPRDGEVISTSVPVLANIKFIEAQIVVTQNITS